MLVLYQRKDNQRRVQLDRSKQRKERVKLLLARCTDPDKENSNPDIHILLQVSEMKKKQKKQSSSSQQVRPGEKKWTDKSIDR